MTIVEERGHAQQSEMDEAQGECRATDVVVMSRRTMLHRSALGLGGTGMVALLSACADEDDEDEEPFDSDPLVDPEPQIEDHTDIVETEVVEDEED